MLEETLGQVLGYLCVALFSVSLLSQQAATGHAHRQETDPVSLALIQ